MHKTLADHPNADAVVVRADGSVATKEDSRKHSLVADDGPSAKRQCMTLLGTEDGEVDEFDDDYDEEESRFQMDDVDENGHQIIWLD